MALNETYGRYAPVPHVVIDRCDLSAEVKWTYATLYRACWQTDGLYSGSYAKLAELLRTSKNKAYRMVKALEAARMLKTQDDSDRLAMTLNSISLWILNGLYDVGIEVPYFTNVVTALDIVLKIERSDNNITSIDLDAVLKLAQIGLNLEQTVLFLERFGLNLERHVLFLERLKSAFKALEKPAEKGSKKAPVMYNSNIQSNVSNEASSQTDNSSPFVLNEQEQTFWQLWLASSVNKDSLRTIAVSSYAYGHIQKLAPLIATLDQLDSLIEFTQQRLNASDKIKDKHVQLGNLVNSYSDWKRSQIQVVPTAKPVMTGVASAGAYQNVGGDLKRMREQFNQPEATNSRKKA